VEFKNLKNYNTDDYYEIVAPISVANKIKPILRSEYLRGFISLSLTLSN
jgi:hypothetical protein